MKRPAILKSSVLAFCATKTFADDVRDAAWRLRLPMSRLLQEAITADALWQAEARLQAEQAARGERQS